MTTMAQPERASAALRTAEAGGFLKGSLMPGMFGCPDCRTTRMVTSAQPSGRCDRCGAQMTILNAQQVQSAILQVD